MGPRESGGLQVGIAFTTPTKNLPIFPFGQQQSEGPDKRSDRIGTQETDSASLEPERRVFQPHDSKGQGSWHPVIIWAP